jgi:MYXO-CTERM domain-containing protein
MKWLPTSAALGASLGLTLGLPSIAHAGMAASAVRETQKIRPTDPAPPAASSIALSCAQNEFCAFQIAVTASGSAVTVSDISASDWGDAGGDTIAGSSAMIYREGFLDVTTPSNSEGMTGQWPDPMIPKIDDFYGETRNALPYAVPDGQTQAIWVEVHVPDGQKPGMYSSSVAVVAESAATVVLTVTIHVRAFSLPSTSSLGSAYGFDWDGPCVGHFGGYGPPDCDDAQLEALNAIYFEDALNHRLTISELVYAPPITNGTGDFTTFDTLYGPFLDGTALTKKDQLKGAAITEIAYTGDQVAASYTAWATHFKAKGWFDKVFDYTCDEPPNGCAWSDIPTRAAIVHAGDPMFRTLTTTSIQEATSNGVLSSLNILVPIINYMYGTSDDPYPGDQRAQYDAFVSTPNNLLWMYQSCEPSSSCSNGSVEGYSGWPTMFIDEPALSNRIMPWMDFAYQVTTDLYYDTTYAMSQASQDSWTTQYEFGNNGDGSIFYPGKPSLIGGTHDIPVESFRMKMIREGMQDYEYLHKLVTLGDTAFANMELAKVVTNAGSFTSDPAVLEEARLAMADEIEKDLKVSSDGGTSDSGSSGDGGTSGKDGGTHADGSAASDAGAGDGGHTTGSGSSGCGCTVVKDDASVPPAFLLLGLVGLAGEIRRSRRASGRR